MANANVKRFEEHLNFKCSLVALSVTGKALENVTDTKLQAVHDSITRKLGGLTPCSQQCSARQRNVNRWCSTCDLWRRELLTYITGQHIRIGWDKMKSWEWPLHHRNLAEVFTTTHLDSTNMNLKDVSTSLSIWNRCKEFPIPFVQNSKSLQKARNKLFHVHAPNLCMTSSEMKAVFRAINKVLNYGHIIPMIQNYNEVIKVINDLEQGDLYEHEMEASNALKKIAGTNEEMLAKLANFQTNVDRLEKTMVLGFRAFCILVLVIPICLSCAAVLFMRTVGDTADDFAIKENYEPDMINISKGCLPERPHRMLKNGINMEIYLVRDNPFVGRDWLFDDLEEKIVNASTNRGVVMIADMGYGKSAIIAQIVCSSDLDVGFKLRQRLVAYHICKFDVVLSKRSNTFIKRLSSMIAQRLVQFAYFLEKDGACLENYNSDTCEQDPFGCMDQCLIDPLRKIQLAENETYIIAIDALDECEDIDGDNDIFDLLNSERIKQIPNSFKFIITSRNINAYYALDTEFSFMVLRDNDDVNLKDINSFIYDSNKDKTITVPTQNISNFLLMAYIIKNQASFEEGQQIPKSIYKFYWNQFQRLFGKQYAQPKAVLEIVCASLSPPTENYVKQITQGSVDITDEQFLSVMEKFQHIATVGWTALHLNHMSLKNWLLSNVSGRYKLNIKRGHTRHAYFLFDNLNHNKTVDLVDIAIHISYASSRDELMGMFHRISQSKLKESKIMENDLPLHRLVKQCDCENAIELLHYHFRDVNELNQAGMSPLYLAASLGRTKIFQYLLNHNSDINFRRESYSNVIHLGLAAEISFHDRHWGYGIMDIAAQNNHIDILRNIFVTDFTVSRYHFYKMNDLNLLPIHLACKAGHTKSVKIIVEHMANMLDDLCLYLAAEKGNVDVVKLALNNGIADTCRACPEQLYWVPENKRRIQGRDILSDDGYNKNNYVLFYDWHLIMCETALHAAVRANKMMIVKILTSQPSNALSCIDRSGKTPLISAIVSNCMEVFYHITLKYGFDVYLKCQQQNDITYISQLSEIEQINLHTSMCDSGSPILHIAAKYDRLWVFREVEQMGTKWTEIPRDSDGCHAAHVAACHGSLSVLEFIMSVEENILQLYCKNGSDPLQSALTCVSFESVNFFMKRAKRFLIFHKSNASKYLFTAVKVNISIETADDAKEIVDKLYSFVQSFIAHGSLLSVMDQYERNIFHYAISNGHYRLISELLDLKHENVRLLKAKDIYGKIPIVHGLENLPGISTVKFIMTTNYTQLFSQLSSILSSQEYSCFITLSFMKRKLLLKEGMLKTMMKLLVYKRRLSLFTAIHIYIDDEFDIGLINYMINRENSNIFLSNYISTSTLKARKHSSFEFEFGKKIMSAMHCKRLSVPCTLHDIARNSNVKISVPKVHKNVIHAAYLNNFISAFFNVLLTSSSILRESLDHDGYNVLERAVQSSNIELVKELNKMKMKLNKKVEHFLLSTVFHNSSNSIVIVFKGFKDNLLTFDMIQDQGMIYTNILNNTGKSQAHKTQYLTDVLKNDFDFLKGYYRQIHDQMDTISAKLLTENRKNISKEFICSCNSRNFSFVHLVAMQGYINTLKIIRKYWGPYMMKCTNTDKFTPLYLAKIFDNKVIIKYLEEHQVETRVPQRDAEVHFIFKIWSRFLLKENGKNKLYCLYQLRRNTLTNIHAGFKAFRCMKRIAEALGVLDKLVDGLAELKSILIFVSNVNMFKHNFEILRYITRLKPHTFDVYQIYKHSLDYHFRRAEKNCQIASKAFLKGIYLSVNRQSKCGYNVESIGYQRMQVLSDVLSLNIEYFSFRDCVDIIYHTINSPCPGLSHINMIKRTISSSKSNVRHLIKKLLSSIMMHSINFYFTSVYFSQRVMPDDMVVSGTWLWDHHLYGYMDVIENMTFYQETFMVNEGRLSDYLRRSVEIKNSANYLQWSNNARTLVDQFADKLKHG